MYSKRRLMSYLALQGSTLGELADFIGIDRSTLSRKVNGQTEWTRSEIQKTCEFLHLTSPKLIFFIDNDA